MLRKMNAYYSPNEQTKIICDVAAFPAPDISWNFLKAPNYPSFNGSEDVKLMVNAFTIIINQTKIIYL